MISPIKRFDRAPFLAAACAIVALLAASRAEAQSNGDAVPAGEQTLTPEQKAKIEEMKARRKKSRQPDGAPDAAPNGVAQPPQTNSTTADNPTAARQSAAAGQLNRRRRTSRHRRLNRRRKAPRARDLMRPIEQATPPPSNQPPQQPASPAGATPPAHQAAPTPAPNRNVDGPYTRRNPSAQPYTASPTAPAGKPCTARRQQTPQTLRKFNRPHRNQLGGSGNGGGKTQAPSVAHRHKSRCRPRRSPRRHRAPAKHGLYQRICGR